MDPDQARHFVGPDLGPNWLQVLSADTLYWGVTGYDLKANIVFLSLKIYFVLANNADPDEMQVYAGSSLFTKISISGHWNFP